MHIMRFTYTTFLMKLKPLIPYLAFITMAILLGLIAVSASPSG